MANLGSFDRFAKAFDKHTLFALIPALAITFVLDLVFSLQPPWPKSSTYITAFLELAAMFLAYFAPVKNKASLWRLQIALFLSIFACFIGYFVLYSFFVFDTPLNDERVVAGFQCTRETLALIRSGLIESCPFLKEEFLASAQYETDVLWTRSSIVAVEIALFFCWSTLFILTTFLFGISIAFMARQPEKRPRRALKRDSASG